jgi:hypothetical protein
MVMINRATKEMTFKVVYYGPGLCGKTTNLEYIYSSAHPDRKGKLLTVATETDRTLFFDFLPMELGTIRGMKVRVQLYTVPGQVFYDATRRIVLRGSDGVVFVADSQRIMMDANIESLDNLKTNLRLNSLDPETVPLALQYNKQDLPDVATQEDLDAKLNWRHVPSFLSVATTGMGVNETLKKVIELVIRKLQAADAHFGGRETEASARAAEKEPAPVPVQSHAPIPEEEEVPEPPRTAQSTKPALPEVELEEDASPSFGADDEMEAVEIETLQDVEPLPMPAGSSRGGELPLESVGPDAGEGPQEREVSTPPEPEPEIMEISEPEPEVLEIPEPEPEMIEICEEEPVRVEPATAEPEPEPDLEPPVAVPTVDLDILRAALVALQERVEAVAARARDLDGEAQALREQIETVNKDLLG